VRKLDEISVWHDVRPVNFVVEFAVTEHEVDMHDLGIVIVNWNTGDYLERCLETVFASEGDFSYKVVVVDNNSDDDSALMVRDKFPHADLIVNDENIGYPRANNVGLRYLGYHDKHNVDASAARYALLLNPDTELPTTALYNMIQFMDSRPDVGVAGPKLILNDGSLDKACRRGFPTPLVSFYHYSGLAKLFPKNERFGRYNMTFADENEELEVDSVVGAYMQVRKEAIEKAGLLDEIFFMYGEDLDWAYRIIQAGYKVWYYPKVVVHHIKRAASSQSPKAQFEFWRAMLIFYRKHFRETTWLPIHMMILSVLLMKGGRDLWSEIQNPTT
jgi:N-acetylglucosaminyl-diphospho-decaprenol L-rhamnosyltransferase